MENTRVNTQESLHALATKPQEDGLPKKVYSRSKEVLPLSFYDKSQWKKPENMVPQPIYNTEDGLNIIPPDHYEKLFSQFDMEDDGRLKLIDEEIRKSQSGVIIDVLKQAGLSILEGKGMVGVSLPVRIFEPRSTIERITDVWGFAPYFLNKVADDNHVEKIKATLSMVVSCQPFLLSQWKPFNPLLGETYSAILLDGTKIECEHTSHHPPVTNYYITLKRCKIYGSFTYNAEIKANSLKAFNEGWGTIVWDNGAKIKFSQPMSNIGGTVMGTRDLKYSASICAVDEQNGVKGVVKMSADAKSGLTSWFYKSRYDTFRGSVYFYDKKKHNDMCKLKWNKMIREFSEMTDLLQEIEKIEGVWHENIKFNNVEYWNQRRDLKFYQPKFIVNNPLPSDCRFREDILWLGYKDKDLAGKWKVKLEEQQRYDRKIRKDYAGGK